MKVFKFGGTSTGAKENFRTVLQIIDNDERKIVVLSAFSGITDSLFRIVDLIRNGLSEKASTELANFKNKNIDYVSGLFSRVEFKNKARDIIMHYVNHISAFIGKSISDADAKMVVSFGEMISTKVLHLALSEHGISSIWINATDFLRIDDREQPDLTFLKDELSIILNSCQEEKIIITQGYVCRNHKGETDNLKRGGSDYTATLIGAAIQASEIQIWSDVDGLQNNDPRCVENTFTISEITFESAAKLACYGAKILHPLCILPAMEYNIPVLLKNTLNPGAKGTLICKTIKKETKAIAARDKVIILKLKKRGNNDPKNFADALSHIFNQNNITPIIQLAENDVVHVLMDSERLCNQLLRSLEEVAKIEVERYQTIVCVTGLKKYTYQNIIGLLAIFMEFPIKLTYFREKADHLLVVLDSEYKKEILKRLNLFLFKFEISLEVNSIAA